MRQRGKYQPGRALFRLHPSSYHRDQGKIALDARSIATNELGLSFFQSFSPANIINRIIEDAQEMGGDKDYKVDIGV